MLKGIKDHEEFKKEGDAYWNIYQEMVQLLVGEAAKRCHGATIIWLPEKQIVGVKQSLIAKYPIFQEPQTPTNIANLSVMENNRVRVREEKQKMELIDNSHVDLQVLEDTISECKKRLVDHN